MSYVIKKPQVRGKVGLGGATPLKNVMTVKPKVATVVKTPVRPSPAPVSTLSPALQTTLVTAPLVRGLTPPAPIPPAIAVAPKIAPIPGGTLALTLPTRLTPAPLTAGIATMATRPAAAPVKVNAAPVSTLAKTLQTAFTPAPLAVPGVNAPARPAPVLRPAPIIPSLKPAVAPVLKASMATPATIAKSVSVTTATRPVLPTTTIGRQQPAFTTREKRIPIMPVLTDLGVKVVRRPPNVFLPPTLSMPLTILPPDPGTISRPLDPVVSAGAEPVIPAVAVNTPVGTQIAPMTDALAKEIVADETSPELVDDTGTAVTTQTAPAPAPGMSKTTLALLALGALGVGYITRKGK